MAKLLDVPSAPAPTEVAAGEQAIIDAYYSRRFAEAAIPKALKKAQPGTEQFRAALRDAIEQTKGLKTAGAVVTMSPTDHTGINKLGIVVVRVENGKWKLESHADYK